MAKRKTDKRLEALINDGAHIYSISKLNTLNQCPYQAYMTYVEHRPQKNVGIYGILGEKCHDKLEEIIKNEAVPNDIKQAVQEELNDLEMCGVDFPLDKNGNSTIKNNWIANMMTFADYFERPDGDFETEQLCLYNVKDEIWMQGYIDLIRNNDDGSIDIIDWKTSSQFTGKHLVEAGRQLVLYALAKRQEGYKVNSVKWYMLKYCETTYPLKNGKTKSKVSEWRNFVKDLSVPITNDLTSLGYDDIDSEIMLNEAVENNNLDNMPDEIKNKYKPVPYVREYELTDEIIDETLEYINKSIEQFESPDNKWNPCDINKESFFCSSLCGYGGKSGQCKYYVDYCDAFDGKSDDDLF